MLNFIRKLSHKINNKCSKTEPGRFKTSVDNIFVAGDMHTGQSLVVKVIRQGRECAREVDKSLMGYLNMFIQ